MQRRKKRDKTIGGGSQFYEETAAEGMRQLGLDITIIYEITEYLEVLVNLWLIDDSTPFLWDRYELESGMVIVGGKCEDIIVNSRYELLRFFWIYFGR